MFVNSLVKFDGLLDIFGSVVWRLCAVCLTREGIKEISFYSFVPSGAENHRHSSPDSTMLDNQRLFVDNSDIASPVFQQVFHHRRFESRKLLFHGRG